MRNAISLSSLLCLVLLSALVANAQSTSHDALVLVVNREPKVVSIFKADGPSLTLLKTLPVGKEAREVFVSPDGKRAYVSNLDDNSVTVVDLDSLAVVATITDPNIGAPDGGIVSPDSKKVYVTSWSKNAVVVIDAATNKVTKVIPTGRPGPRRLIISPDGKKMYVGHQKGHHLAVIDLASNKVVSYIKVGNECRGGFGFTDGGKLLLNACVEDDAFSFIDTATGQAIRTSGTLMAPQRIAVTPRGDILVLCGGGPPLGGHAIEVISNREARDNNRPYKIIQVGNSAWGLAVNPSGTMAYSSNYKDGTLTITDLVKLEVVQTMPIGKDPNGVAFRPER